ncbi:hypothetical protein GCM10023216_21530 [Isoptericola chiayiensis]|uniref:Lipoprotein n=1 Tax=Isoptericola chiayiensis TaxID=579446 RepID=A0ABP8YIU9_9MICO|nr:hypothetical protein [Isoptericola chiayiensis]NOW00382.1 hypothetical protein [Isoptericola chiayiensis]
MRDRLRRSTAAAALVLIPAGLAGCTATDTPSGAAVDQRSDLVGTFEPADGGFQVVLDAEEFTATDVPAELLGHGDPQDVSGTWSMPDGEGLFLEVKDPGSDELVQQIPVDVVDADELVIDGGTEGAVTLERVD